MKMMAEYLEHAHRFEQLAATESNLKTKAQFEDQAKAYRKLALKRAKALGLSVPEMPPDKPPQSN
jgi:hypothetical protein